VKQLDPPVCKHCEQPLSLRYRERVSGRMLGVLWQDEETGDFTFQTDETTCDSSDELETWWACTDFDCEKTLRRLGEDWPYEQEFEGEIEYI